MVRGTGSVVGGGLGGVPGWTFEGLLCGGTGVCLRQSMAARADQCSPNQLLTLIDGKFPRFNP